MRKFYDTALPSASGEPASAGGSNAPADPFEIPQGPANSGLPDPASIFNAPADSPAGPPAPGSPALPTPGAAPAQQGQGPVPAPNNAPQPNQPPANAFDEAAWLQEKTAGKAKSVDELLALINREPEKVVEIKAPEFANEEGKRIYEALQAGKLEEVTNFLSQRAEVQRLKDATPDQLIKAHLSKQYPSLTPQMVDAYYAQNFVVDTESAGDNLPIQQAMMTDKVNAAAVEATKFFSQFASDIKLPELSPAAQQGQQNNAALDLSNPVTKEVADFAQGLMPAFGENLSFAFANNTNSISVKGDIPISPEEVASMQAVIEKAPDAFIFSKYFTKEGEFNGKLFATEQSILKNLTSILAKVADQSSTQTQLQILQRNRNYQPGPPTPTGDLELDQANKESWNKFFNIPNEAVANEWDSLGNR